MMLAIAPVIGEIARQTGLFLRWRFAVALLLMFFGKICFCPQFSLTMSPMWLRLVLLGILQSSCSMIFSSDKISDQQENCQKLQCGTILVGDGEILDCGDCENGMSCGSLQANVCGEGVCVAKSCESLAIECGLQSDGCADVLDCGNCSGSDSCGALQPNVCDCVPTTCEVESAICGVIDDQCGGTIDCSGICGPQELATAEDGEIHDLALDATHIYWAQTGSVMRSLLNGTEIELIAPMQSSPKFIAVDSTHVYWSNRTANSVVRRLKIGGPLEEVANLQMSASGVAVDEDHVYWSVSDGNSSTNAHIMRRAKSEIGGGLPEEIFAANQSRGDAIVLDATHVYWTTASSGSSSTVRRLAKNGSGEIAVVAPDNNGFFNGMAVDDSFVYWTDSNADAVMRRPKVGGFEDIKVFAAEQPNAHDVAVDATHVYWVNKRNSGSVMRRAKGGGEMDVVEELATEQNGAARIALDATYIYWVNENSASVNRLSRCDCDL